jgi:hypothetical protein
MDKERIPSGPPNCVILLSARRTSGFPAMGSKPPLYHSYHNRRWREKHPHNICVCASLAVELVSSFSDRNGNCSTGFVVVLGGSRRRRSCCSSLGFCRLVVPRVSTRPRFAMDSKGPILRRSDHPTTSAARGVAGYVDDDDQGRCGYH